MPGATADRQMALLCLMRQRYPEHYEKLGTSSGALRHSITDLKDALRLSVSQDITKDLGKSVKQVYQLVSSLSFLRSAAVYAAA